ncbi:unannotated protein [freshwater metagenome]|uniref:Unannotated protein n=1 Tax=freshwater metagenome TaxID=449393 RepID=A0A6J6JYK2_9ZZZZ
MAHRNILVKTFSFTMAGAMLLASCGGGDNDSRTRNAAIDQSNCWITQQAKDEALTTLGAQIAEATKAAGEIGAANDEYTAAAQAVQVSYEAYLNTAAQQDDWTSAFDQYAEDKERANAAYDTWKALSERVNSLSLLNEQMSQESSKPLCGESTLAPETTQLTTESPTTTPTSQGGSTGSLGIDDPWCSQSYVMQNSLKVGEITNVGIIKCGNLQGVITVPDGLSSVPSQNDREFVWTLQAIVPGTHEIELFHIDPATSEEGFKQTYTIEVSGELTAPGTQAPPTSIASPPTTSSVETIPCNVPVPREGQYFVVNKGDVIDLTFDLCGPLTAIATNSDDWNDTDFIGYTDEGGVTLFNVRFPNVGTSRLHFYVYEMSPFRYLTDASIVTVIVRDPSVSDPCEGKAPEGLWEPELEGGTFTATSTCDGITTLKVVVDKLVGEERTQVFNGYMASDFGHIDLIQMFGEGTYKVYLRHVTRANVGEEWMTVGDAGWIEVTYTAPSDNTPTNAVTLFPTAIFDPSITESPADPRAASPEVPVVAVPGTTSVLTCNQACIDSLLTRAGVTSGTVEIAFGEGDFEKVSTNGSFIAPLTATSVRVRVTPTNGEPVTMAAVFTRDSVNEAYAQAAMEEVRTDLATTVSESGTSFPWWIIAVAILVLVAVGEAFRRRLKGKPEAA